VSAILPGGRIGFLGGGQLAQMLALEARRMGYATVVVTDEEDAPGVDAADRVFSLASLASPAGLDAFADACDVVTLETEHIPLPLLRAVASRMLLRPGAEVLAVVADRLSQRQFLERNGLPQTAFAPVSESADFATAAERTGFPAVLKTRQGGYDGRGQVRVARASDLPAAWESLGRLPCVLEAFVRFSREISVVAARSPGGELRYYPLAENEHRHHVLHRTLAPAPLPAGGLEGAQAIAAKIATAFDYVGVFAVELFVGENDVLLVNEIAPRVHNSGHFTWGGCRTSQFEQHLRAICGLPLGDPSLHRPAVMLNLLGDLWQDGAPAWERVLAVEGVNLHLYGKKHARPGRKMGHLVLTGADVAGALATSEHVSALLGQR